MTLRPVSQATPVAPGHLSDAMKVWWSSVMKDYDLEPHHVHLVTHAAEAWDRAEQARKVLDAEGLTSVDRFGQTRLHPLVPVERDSRAAHARLLRELDLDASPSPAIPTRRGGRYK